MRLGIVREGDVVLDCGAHAGQMATLFALLAGPRGRVIAFDRFPQNTLQIEAQARLNGLGNLDAVRAGLGARRERLELSVLGQATTPFDRTRALTDLIAVEIVPLDDYAEAKPTVIKLGIEGAGVVTLRRAQSLLRACRPRLFTELHTQMVGQFGHAPADLFAAIPADLYDIRYKVEGMDHAWRRSTPRGASRLVNPALVLAEPRAG